jgi:hypothetical protein
MYQFAVINSQRQFYVSASALMWFQFLRCTLETQVRFVCVCEKSRLTSANNGNDGTCSEQRFET